MAKRKENVVDNMQTTEEQKEIYVDNSTESTNNAATEENKTTEFVENIADDAATEENKTAESVENTVDEVEHFIYIGPTIPCSPLIHNKIYRSDDSAMLLIKETIKKYPSAAQMFISTENFTPMHKRTTRAFYNKLAKKIGAATI